MNLLLFHCFHLCVSCLCIAFNYWWAAFALLSFIIELLFHCFHWLVSCFCTAFIDWWAAIALLSFIVRCFCTAFKLLLYCFQSIRELLVYCFQVASLLLSILKCTASVLLSKFRGAILLLSIIVLHKTIQMQKIHNQTYKLFKPTTIVKLSVRDIDITMLNYWQL